MARHLTSELDEIPAQLVPNAMLRSTPILECVYHHHRRNPLPEQCKKKTGE